MKNILIPTDFSNAAHNAVDFSTHIFEGEEVNCTLLNSYIEPPLTDDVLISIHEILNKQSKEDLDNEVELITKEHSNDNFHWRKKSRYGFLSDAIKQQIIESNIDLVIMGTKGASGLQKIFGGSNAADVVKNIKCPLLIVPENVHFTSLEHIILAADYKKINDDSLLKTLSEIAIAHHSEIFIVNVHPSKDSLTVNQKVEEVRLNRILQSVYHEFVDLESDDVAEAIDLFANKNDAHLIVMLAREHDFINRIFKGSETRKMAMMTNIPLLILPDK